MNLLHQIKLFSDKLKINRIFVLTQFINKIKRIVHDLIYKIIASLERDEVAKKLAISYFRLDSVQSFLTYIHSHAIDNSVKLTMGINKTITNTVLHGNG